MSPESQDEVDRRKKGVAVKRESYLPHVPPAFKALPFY